MKRKGTQFQRLSAPTEALNPADFPNLPPEALALAQSDPELFNRMYPLKLHDLGMLRGV